MKKYQENRNYEAYVARVFTFLRGKNQGDTILVRDKHTDQDKEVSFVRRGRLRVSVADLGTGQTELYDLERVVLDED
jgi:hypothetical protein